MNDYEKNGYENRQEYLEALSYDHGIDLDQVLFIADILGESEDFDGLITTLEDMDVDSYL